MNQSIESNAMQSAVCSPTIAQVLESLQQLGYSPERKNNHFIVISRKSTEWTLIIVLEQEHPRDAVFFRLTAFHPNSDWKTIGASGFCLEAALNYCEGEIAAGRGLEG